MRRSEIEELTAFEEAFCQEYVRDLNATKAYLRAHELIDNTISYTTASSYGNVMLNKPHVRDRVDAILAERSSSNADIFDRLTSDLRAQAFYDVNDYADFDGNILKVKNLNDIPPELRPAIKSIESTAYGFSIKFQDRQKAQEMLARLLGFWEENIRLQAGEGVNINIDIPRPEVQE